jgi:hypothetical protein
MPSTKIPVGENSRRCPTSLSCSLAFPPKEEGTKRAGQKQNLNRNNATDNSMSQYFLINIQFMNYGDRYECLVRYKPQLHPEDSGMFNNLPETTLQH